MIQPDADEQSEAKPSASALATAEPLSLPPDEVGELIERLERGECDGWANIEALMSQAASTLSRLRGERNYLLRRWKAAEELACAALHATSDVAGNALDGWSPDASPNDLRECAYEYRATLDPSLRFEPSLSEAARLKAEDINRKLVEGLRRGTELLESYGDPGDDLEFIKVRDANRSLLSSISGGEAAGEDGP